MITRRPYFPLLHKKGQILCTLKWVAKLPFASRGQDLVYQGVRGKGKGLIEHLHWQQTGVTTEVRGARPRQNCWESKGIRLSRCSEIVSKCPWIKTYPVAVSGCILGRTENALTCPIPDRTEEMTEQAYSLHQNLSQTRTVPADNPTRKWVKSST